MPQTATENHATERGSAPSGTGDVIAKTVSITKMLFPGDVRVEAEEDPEIAELSYVVFNVAATGGLREIIERRLEWHRRIAELGGDSSRLKLSVDAGGSPTTLGIAVFGHGDAIAARLHRCSLSRPPATPQFHADRWPAPELG